VGILFFVSIQEDAQAVSQQHVAPQGHPDFNQNQFQFGSLEDLRRDNILKFVESKIPIGDYEWGKPPPDNGTDYDCSGLVSAAIQEAIGKDPFKSDRMTTVTFKEELDEKGAKIDCAQAKPGDIIWWQGHIGLVSKPEQGLFIGAQSAKLNMTEASYETGHWGAKAGKACYKNVYLQEL